MMLLWVPRNIKLEHADSEPDVERDRMRQSHSLSLSVHRSAKPSLQAPLATVMRPPTVSRIELMAP